MHRLTGLKQAATMSSPNTPKDLIRLTDSDNPDGHHRTPGDTLLPLSATEKVVDALNRVQESEGSPIDKTRRLLADLRPLLGRDADVELVLQNEVERDPAPRVIERVFVGPTFDRIEPRPHEQVQELLDASRPAAQKIVPVALSRLRRPVTFVVGQDIPDREWFEDIRKRFLEPVGWADVLCSLWAAGNDRLLTLGVLQRIGEPPHDAETRRRASLILRAAAPFVVTELFGSLEQPGDSPHTLMENRQLSDRQGDVLVLLLRGMSEKEVARELGVSTHTVHTHVKKLYSEFEVSSRGELLARFIDQKVLEMIQEPT